METFLLIALKYTLIVPGAFVRWLFHYKKRTFESVLDDDTFLNANIGTLAITLIVGLVYVFL
ncbi:MAG: hypothetical protein CME62_12455 [Halobacteriovoraceae bacterium]|nr:hypothetical protein [Halobacteriovoraceae bacterium]|tara:strand:- start:3827 stop:4012 length:186 start_codon:yes stop_codon:yes gene_type:complete